MGIGITGISKVKLLPCSEDDNCPCLEEDEEDEGEFRCRDEVHSVDVPCTGADAVKMGCYVAGRGGRRFSFDFSYAGYRGWIRRLSLMALGVETEEVWAHPRRFWGKPFVELINFGQTDGGAIGPITSAYLYGDFVAFAPKAKRYYATSTPNVFDPPRVNPQSATDKMQRNRMGLSSVVGLLRSLGATVFEWDEGENLYWMWESYQELQRAFRLAKNAGGVAFY